MSTTIYRIVFNDGNAIKIEADEMNRTKCGVTIFSAWKNSNTGRGMQEVCVIPHANCMSIHALGPTLRINRLREEAKRLREGELDAATAPARSRAQGDRPFHKIHYYANGYAASVVADPAEPFIEVAILNNATPGVSPGTINYTTSLTSDVERFDGWFEVYEFCFKVSCLPAEFIPI